MRFSPNLGSHANRPGTELGRSPRFCLLLAPCALLLLCTARAEPTFFAARVAPIFEKHCVGCHGAEKHKAGLRLDSFANAMHGGEAGEVIKPADVKGSELYRRITLPATDEDVMPSDGKPLLSADEIKIIELWIASGATATKPLADFPTAPVPRLARPPAVPLAPDWHPQVEKIAALEKETGLKLVPRSQVATDGLILRTASAPSHCDDAVLAKLAPVAALIVDAELARTNVTDAGLKTIGTWENLRALDLTRTAVSSKGLEAIVTLKKLESLNLTSTGVDRAGVEMLKQMGTLKHVWLFGTKAEPEDAAAKMVSGRTGEESSR